MSIDYSSIRIDEFQAAEIAKKRYGLTGQATALRGEFDFNFRLIANETCYLLKISRPEEDVDYLEFQNSLIDHVGRSDQMINGPRVFSDLDGNSISKTIDASGRDRQVRLLSWLDGRLWSAVNPINDVLRRDLGQHAGQMTCSLQGFEHAYGHQKHEWILSESAWTLNHKHLFDDQQRECLEYFQEQFSSIQSIYSGLRTSIIHGDINDNNIVVSNDLVCPEVRGIIDFGDANHSQTINELAIALAYVIMGQPDPVAATLPVIQAFHRCFPVQEQELECLYALIGMRLVTSVTKSAINRIREPENQYLLVSEKPAWNALEKWSEVQPDHAHFRFREACGLPPHFNQDRFAGWANENPVSIADLFPSTNSNSVKRIDMSVSGHWLGHESKYNDLDLTEFKLEMLRDQHPGSIIAGGYLETRPFYSTGAYGREGNEGPEYRTVHLGTDFWLPANTPVHAVLGGTVFSVFDNDQFKDYGPTVILQHRPKDQFEFWTLYGHLSKSSLELLNPGDSVQPGDQIGYIGDANENGNWACHLHFQIMLDMLGNQHDFPGVAVPRETEFWGSLCPDAAIWFSELPEFEKRHVDSSQLMAFRKKHLGKGLSVSYDQPLHIVRGSGVHLIDSTGRKYLDTVNNVAHVGHEHPRVVEVAQNQIALLNTNTRYLHSAIEEFATELLSTLPDDLSVVHVVNSGSEANELAIRMAKTYTRQRDFIALEMGYHGNSNACVDISSYKFDGNGGSGAPAHTHPVPLPDTFRGRHQGDGAGLAYAQYVLDQIASIRNLGRQVAGFICESIVSCGGQIELPDGFLEEAYRAVRAAGGICIADEVQTGCGRVGSHFWAFQLHGVTPDIVTIGKPIGNGHPLGAVVCTRAVADAFANGMEYFNTFGGNPVSCSIGAEVLRVIRDEGLQSNAQLVGSWLKSSLVELSGIFPIIQDIRGQGLFLGFEMVDRQKTPLANHASRLTNRLRNLGILTSTDGKDHNAIKIKPPMVFSENDAKHFLGRLEQILAEDYFQQF